MASVTDIKTPELPGRWFRMGRRDDQRAELGSLFDLYWGGSERRITGLTLRIMAVNAVAVLMLLLGVVYLGKMQNRLVDARLETFHREVQLIALSFSQMSENGRNDLNVYYEDVGALAEQLDLKVSKDIYIFNQSGDLVLKTQNIARYDRAQGLQSVQLLKDIVGFVLSWLPERQVFPPYHYPDSTHAQDYPDVREALQGNASLSAWQGRDEQVFLSAAAPLGKGGEYFGAFFMTWDGYDLEDELSDMRFSIFSIFAVTLILTTFLSIYLAGTIARPLKKLAKASEALRSGRGTAEDIPDFSDRMDEIGDLSLVLRDMTAALWERMDLIESFAADVAHELKNPLTSLRSAIETLPVVKKKADKERLMEIIYHDINRLDRLITDISYASRLDTELSREAFAKVDLRALLHGLLASYGDPMARHEGVGGWNYKVKHEGIVIKLQSDLRGLAYVWGIEGRLEQVFQNVISNALSFAPEGSTVLLRVTRTKSRVVIEIENEGPEIPKEKLEAIFERFYSERPESESYGQNSGLGLSICKQIMEAHRGRIFADNLFDGLKQRGVRFSVVLNSAELR